MERRKIQFDVYGPFPIPREYGAVDDTSRFWERVGRFDGLADAAGCYVFAVKPSGRNSTPIPYYVGKTERSFYEEVFKSHKIVIYNRVLRRRRRAKPLLFLLPLLTPTGKFASPKKRPIRALEDMLTFQAIVVNPDCENKRGTSMQRRIEVIGAINTGRRAKGGRRKKLRTAFGLR